VPSWWTEYDGGIWDDYWGNIHFQASRVVVTTDMDAFWSTWNTPGMILAASEDWGDIGGYLQLLDGTQSWFSDCKKEARDDYVDEVYEGAYDVWECGTNNEIAVIAARPKSDPYAFLILVQIYLGTTQDYDTLNVIMDSFDVVGNLP
jgi:hypothetical protein